MTNKSATLLPVYLIIGDDKLKREQTISRLEKRMEEYGDLSFNYDRFDAQSVNVEDVLASCNTLPFMSDKRLVVVEGIEAFSPKALSVLDEYMHAVAETTVLALVGVKLAKNTKLYKSIASFGNTVVNCDLPKDEGLKSIANDLARASGCTFEKEALNRLIEFAGTDTIALKTEIEKLALHHGSNTPITISDVESLVEDKSTVKPWVFLDSISERNLKKSLMLLEHMSHESPYYLVSAIEGRLKELITFKSLQDQGLKATAAALGKQDWQLKRFPSFVSNFSAQTLVDCYRASLEAEHAMKSGTEALLALQNLIMFVCTK